MELNTNIEELKGIGEKTALLYHKLGIYTLRDLIQHYPRSYEAFEEPKAASKEDVGHVVAIRAILLQTPVLKRTKSLQIVTSLALTDSKKLYLTWFNMPFLKKSMTKGQVYIFRGILQENGTTLFMEQPKFYSVEAYQALLHTLQPLYTLTAKLSNQAVTKAIRQVLEEAAPTEEYLQEQLLEQNDLCSLPEAIKGVHFPTDMSELMRARNRLVFDEFLSFILQLRLLKEHTHEVENHYSMLEVAETERLIESLPYQLTGAQRKVWNEVKEDLQGKYTMNRLVQGDVGSGKTIIAVLAAIMAGVNGCQTAFMVPTEVLAEQHFETVSKLLEQYRIPLKTILLTGSMTTKKKTEAYERIQSGEVQIIIGTHALIQEKVHYQKLALAITDEQHRFGVRQREILSEKSEGDMPHVLVMSATPIPRTLGIILYGDLDVSVIDELPAERLPIKNCVVNTGYRKKAYEFMQSEIDAGRQVYIICPMVEESESIEAEDVISYTKKLKEYFPPRVQIAYLHGKMKPQEKNRTMEAFARNDIHILVSTTVVEVGVNVPNASVMLIENANRFGLSQLHQLRGRIGRGSAQSYCIFMSSSASKPTMDRLEVLNRSNDGFYIASEDLKTRGPGDFFGIRQSGAIAFRIADIFTDASVLQKASEAANEILKQDSELCKEENAKLKKQLNLFTLTELNGRMLTV